MYKKFNSDLQFQNEPMFVRRNSLLKMLQAHRKMWGGGTNTKTLIVKYKIAESYKNVHHYLYLTALYYEDFWTCVKNGLQFIHRWIKWFLPQKQNFNMKWKLSFITITSMWRFPQFSLSFPGSSAPCSHTSSMPVITCLFWDSSSQLKPIQKVVNISICIDITARGNYPSLPAQCPSYQMAVDCPQGYIFLQIPCFLGRETIRPKLKLGKKLRREQ